MYNYIKEVLEIKDKNIEITGEIRKEKIKGQTTFVVEGKLTYDIEYCPCCGCCKCQYKNVQKFKNKNVQF